MNDKDSTLSMSADERALDAALAQTLLPPSLPVAFRTHLNATLMRANKTERAERYRLDKEYRAWLDELENDYVRLRLRTLGTLIGGAFATGSAIALLMPWFNETFGVNAMFALVTTGIVAGLSIGTISWVRHLGLLNLLDCCEGCSNPL